MRTERKRKRKRQLLLPVCTGMKTEIKIKIKNERKILPPPVQPLLVQWSLSTLPLIQ
jgi:hypothetical protein